MTSIARVCSVDGCERPIKARGFCNAHYQRSIKGGKMTAPIRDKQSATCRSTECNLPSFATSLCRTHYNSYRELLAKKCSIDGCEIGQTARGLCQKHVLTIYKYNVTPEWLIESWRMGCSICGSAEGGYHVDHDHSCCPSNSRMTNSQRSCGECVRGLLCSGCNWGLGQFKDDIQILKSAISYLSSKV